MPIVFITGANRGIGLEFVKQYSQNNWQVIACCRNVEKAKNVPELSSNKNIQLIELDLNNTESINALPHHIPFSSIDVLINNAGILGNKTSFGEIDSSSFSSLLTVNTLAPILISQILTQHLIRGNKKLVVNISSSLGSISLNDKNDFFPIYRISKCGLNAATKCMAHALKEKKITVVAIDPGWVKTDMGGNSAHLTPEASVKQIKETLTKINLSNTGQFLKYDGSTLPW